MAIPKNQMIIPVTTLKSGVFTYKRKPPKHEEKGKDQNGTKETKSLYPKLDAIVNGTSLDAPAECSIIYEENASEFYFKVPSSKKENGEIKYTMLECTNISAADIRVNSKYGWESMNCRLLVECRNPLVAWTTNLNKTTMKTEYCRSEQESCMVKAVFDISAINQLKHLLHSLKVAQLKSRKVALEKVRQGEKNVQVPSKMQEGLPEWVNYIPAKWYSSSVRKVIEYCLIIYTMLTIMWALWQLYKHVDFIRRYIRPVIEFIEFYVQILKSWIRWLDSFADLLTKYWWKYMKPVYVLFVTFYASLSQLFKPLRNIAGVIGNIMGPFVQFFRITVNFMKPALTPLLTCFRLFAAGFHRVAAAILKLWEIMMNSALIRVLVMKCNQLGLGPMFHNIVHGGFDPLKAQIIVIQNLLMKSVKQIYYGGRFISTRIYMTFVFWRRERRYARQDVDDDGKMKDE